ncbi:MAG: PIG-L family deacetylase, partial [Candidatus Saccharimonadales bacterium]
MKKLLFAIFAHPDDEAFGPSGTLLKETQAGTELHLLLLTNGDAGANPDNLDDLGAARLKEWRMAGTLMGAKDMHYFGYKDGQLTNQAMIEAGQRIIEHITPIIQAASDDTIIEFLSNDLNGITGHIDHIIAARIACHVFYSLKHDDARLERIRLSCLPFQDAPESNIHWLYMEAGRTPDEITETVDAH